MFHRTSATAFLSAIILVACSPTAPRDTDTSSSSSSSESIASSSFSSEPEVEPEEPVTYAPGVCGSEVPSKWHVRSAEDQALWNREGNVEPPLVLTADYIHEGFSGGMSTKFKPALFSMADADTYLPGAMEDPEAEDANRNEIDFLRLTNDEMTKLIGLLQTPPSPYAWKDMTVDRHLLQVLVDNDENGKYYGQHFVFVPAEFTGTEYGMIISYRGGLPPFDRGFFDGFNHFLSTMHFAECPNDWWSQ